MKDVLYTVKFGERDIAALLDMLRYDGPTVVTWERVDSRSFKVTLRGRMTRDRWLSFALIPLVVA